MNWKDYEDITRYIYETLGKASGVTIVGHGQACKVLGKSGIYHQVDVLTSHSNGIHVYQTAIECKYWKEPINKDIVMKLLGIINDCNISKGVIVSKKGFTADGIAFAKHHNIGLVELREIEKDDNTDANEIQDLTLASINLNSTIRRPVVLTIDFEKVIPTLLSKEINHYQWKVKHRDREIPLDSYIMEFKNHLHSQTPDQIVEKHYPLKGARIVNVTNVEEFEIDGFRLSGKLTVLKQSRNVEIVDEVWLIMKSLFENKSFRISKAGLISGM